MRLLFFVGSCLLPAMIPGVGLAVIPRRTPRAGRSHGVAAALGYETGVPLWALAAVSGLSALVLASQVAYEVMRAVGAVVLVVIGARSLRRARRGRAGTRQEEPEQERGTPGWRRSYLLGPGTLAADPKAAVFAVAFLPRFVPAGGNVPLTLAALAMIWVVVDALWYPAVIWLTGRVLPVFRRPAVRRRLERVSGVVLIGLGVRLAMEAR